LRSFAGAGSWEWMPVTEAIIRMKATRYLIFL
jgi:hypothetical protein